MAQCRTVNTGSAEKIKQPYLSSTHKHLEGGGQPPLPLPFSVYERTWTWVIVEQPGALAMECTLTVSSTKEHCTSVTADSQKEPTSHCVIHENKATSTLHHCTSTHSSDRKWKMEIQQMKKTVVFLSLNPLSLLEVFMMVFSSPAWTLSPLAAATTVVWGQMWTEWKHRVSPTHY